MCVAATTATATATHTVDLVRANMISNVVVRWIKYQASQRSESVDVTSDDHVCFGLHVRLAGYRVEC
jgi:hypothetical protein